MTQADELVAVLREARALVAASRDRDFLWSSWEDVPAALAELDELLDAVRAGRTPASTVRVVFAPTGPMQELSMAAGWSERFLALADRADRAVRP